MKSKDYPSEEDINRIKESSYLINKITTLIKKLNSIGFIEVELIVIKKHKV